MATTPTWQAARNGLPGHLDATNHATQVAQELGTHAITAVYEGASILTPNGEGGAAWAQHLDAVDISQPFTMSGTSIGRVTIPVLPVGTGSDLEVSLYSDSGGVPGAVIAQTIVTAEEILQRAAIAGAPGPSSQQPVVSYTGNPLATAASNTLRCGPWSGQTWALPSGTATSALTLAVPAISGNYLALLGCLATGSTANAANYVLPYAGGTSLGQLIPQPNLPGALTNGGGTLTTDTALYVGGVIDGVGTALSSVYAAGWDSGTGTISAWSQQASLPAALTQPTVAAFGDTVYVIGGFDNDGNALSAVYWTTVTNGQITSWATSAPLPTALGGPMAAFAIGGFLVISGGAGAVTSAATYYAPIRDDGSLGGWITGPSTSVGTNYPAAANEWGAVITGSIPAGPPGNDVYSLTVTEHGPGPAWTAQTYPFSPNLGTDANFTAMYPVSDGVWQMFVLFANRYSTTTVTLTPTISVPLPATGLTNGATYHVVIQQTGGDANNYVWVSQDYLVFPGSPTYLTRSRVSGSWTPTTTGFAIPIQIFDHSTTGELLHTWEDPDATSLATATLTRITDYQKRLLGIADATQIQNDTLNINPTFTSGIPPWGGVNCTVTQSSAHTQGGLPFSALMTPNGTSGTVNMQSETMPATPGRWYASKAWVYSSGGHGEISPSVAWLDSAGVTIRIDSVSLTVPAATWALCTMWTQSPTGTAQAILLPAEGGTPAVTDTVYWSDVTLSSWYPDMLPSVTQVDYDASGWFPIGTTQL